MQNLFLSGMVYFPVDSPKCSGWGFSAMLKKRITSQQHLLNQELLFLRKRIIYKQHAPSNV
jgi:hypothetical protein